MMNIEIKTIKNKDQRYNTAGDYFMNNAFGIRTILVSELQNDDYEFLIAIHEAIEQHLCLKRGIDEKLITKFDMNYKGLHFDDPGQDIESPYHREHMFALGIEKLLCKEIGIDFNIYNQALDDL